MSSKAKLFVWTAALGIAACPSAPVVYESVDHETAGIFLETESRAALPEGQVLRPVYDKGLMVTKLSEGFRRKLYHDVAGYCTIGYGHLVKKAGCDGTEPEEFTSGINEPRGGEILDVDMKNTRVVVMQAVRVPMTDGQFAALCDFVFNVGSRNFRESTLLKEMNGGRPDRVPFEMRRWILVGGQTIDGLRIRREREIELYFDGLPSPRAAEPEGGPPRNIDIRAGEVPDRAE